MATRRIKVEDEEPDLLGLVKQLGGALDEERRAGQRLTALARDAAAEGQRQRRALDADSEQDRLPLE